MGREGQSPSPSRPEQARVFFALWPDNEVRARLHQAAADGARRFGGRAMQRDTLHLTLVFIGAVPLDDIPRLEDIAAGVTEEAFQLNLDRLGFWSHNHILWAGSRGAVPGLSRLASSLAGRLEAAGYPTGLKANRDFSPHVTLIRNVADKRPEMPEILPIHWCCKSFTLMRSRLSSSGASYEEIARWSLQEH